MQKTEIYTSKKKALWLLMGSLAFVAISIWMFSHAAEMKRNPLLIRTVSIISLLFFGFSFFIAIKQLLKTDLVLVIEPEGITVKPGQANTFHIKWDEITGFKKFKIYQTRIIIILVENPGYWLEKETNMLKKKLMQTNLRNYGSPFNLSANSLSTDHETLMSLLNTYWQAYKTVGK
jgi:hypothetical protein